MAGSLPPPQIVGSAARSAERSSVGVALDDEGRAVAIKRATHPLPARRLRQEAANIERATSLGLAVVELISFRDDPASPELRTKWLTGGTAATWTSNDPDDFRSRAIGIAHAVGGLHAARLRHGRLVAEHVLFGVDGEVRLCSLADIADKTIDPREDILGWARLVVDAAARAAPSAADGATVEEAERLVAQPRRAPATMAGVIEVLERGVTLDSSESGEVASSTSPDGTVVDGPRRLTRAVRDPVFAFFGDDEHDAADDHGAPLAESMRRPLDAPALRRVALLLLAIVVVIVALSLIRSGRSQRSTDSATAPESPQATSPSSAPTDATTAVAPAAPQAGAAPSATAPAPSPTAAANGSLLTATPPCPADISNTAASKASGASRVDVDGDGCVDAITINGGAITALGRTYHVGDTGDLVVLGDWACHGRATPAILRPSTGQVFVFTAWPEDPAHPLAASVLTTVVGARTIDATPPGSTRCQHLRIGHADGTSTEVALP